MKKPEFLDSVPGSASDLVSDLGQVPKFHVHHVPCRKHDDNIHLIEAICGG